MNFLILIRNAWCVRIYLIFTKDIVSPIKIIFSLLKNERKQNLKKTSKNKNLSSNTTGRNFCITLELPNKKKIKYYMRKLRVQKLLTKQTKGPIVRSNNFWLDDRCFFIYAVSYVLGSSGHFICKFLAPAGIQIKLP